MSETREPPKPDDTPPSDKGAFDLEPIPEPPPKPAPPTGASEPAAAPQPKVAAPAPAKKAPSPGLFGRLGGMLDGFDDDADFDHDPEVDAALGKKGAAPSEAVPSRPPFVKDGPVVPGVWLGIGFVLLLGAVVGAAVNEKNHPVAGSFLTIYNALLHTCTGIAALGVTAMLLRRPFGSVEQAGARMFVAVTAFLVLTNTRITLIGDGLWEELILASLAYIAAVAVLFRLWRRLLMYVVCAHFLLWMGVQIGMELSRWVATVPTK